MSNHAIHASRLLAALTLAALAGCGGGGGDSNAKRLTIFVGDANTSGFADASGTAARFHGLEGVSSDFAGNLYLGDSLNARVRKVTPAGVVTTLAGSGFPNTITDGQGTNAGFFGPRAIAIDPTGTRLAVADSAPPTSIVPIGPDVVLGAVRWISIADGTVTTYFPPDATYPNSVAYDGFGNLFTGYSTCSPGSFTDCSYGLSRFVGNDAVVNGPWPANVRSSSMVTDNIGNLYVASADRNTITRFSNGGVTVFAGADGVAGSLDGAGTAARFNGPTGLTIDRDNNIYLADSKNFTVRKITPMGMVSTVAGVAGAQGFVEGDLPGGLATPTAVEVVGNDLFIIMRSGIAVIRNRP
jgi:NHL repeat